MMYRFFFCISVWLLQYPLMAATTTLDLKQTIQYATENSPLFNSLKRQFEISDLEKKNVKARWFPSLDLTAVHGLEEDDPRTKTTPWTSDFSLMLTESLYDNGVTNTNYKIATLNRDISELKFEEQKNRLSLDLAVAFLNYSLNLKLLEIQEKQFKLISKQNELTTREYQNGIRTRKDYLRFKTQVQRSEIDLLNSRSSVETSKEKLLSLMGLGLNDQKSYDFIPVAITNIKEKLDDTPISIEDHALYRSAQLQKKANDLAVDLVNRKQYPELFLSAGAHYSSSNYIDTGSSFSDNERTGWNALLTLRYNFLDWGTRSRETTIATQKAIIQNNELEQSLLDLRTSINSFRISNRQISKNFELARELLSLEKDNINLIEREYRNGKVSYLDLITGLNDFADSERKFFSSAIDILVAKYTQLYHQGKLFDELTK